MSQDLHLTTAAPLRFALMIQDIEAEIVEIYPKALDPVGRGRGKAPGVMGTIRFSGDDESMIRLKWLLQKRKGLYHGRDVPIVVRPSGSRSGYVAFEITPQRGSLSQADVRAAATRSRRRSGRGAVSDYKPRTIALCAVKLGISPMRAARLAITLPAGVELFDHLQKETTQHVPTKNGAAPI